MQLHTFVYPDIKTTTRNLTVKAAITMRLACSVVAKNGLEAQRSLALSLRKVADDIEHDRICTGRSTIGNHQNQFDAELEVEFLELPQIDECDSSSAHNLLSGL